jgi:RNA polymerase primary sigma factor
MTMLETGKARFDVRFDADALDELAFTSTIVEAFLRERSEIIESKDEVHLHKSNGQVIPEVKEDRTDLDELKDVIATGQMASEAKVIPQRTVPSREEPITQSATTARRGNYTRRAEHKVSDSSPWDDVFFSQFKKYEVLTKEQEVDLAQKIEHGREAAAKLERPDLTEAERAAARRAVKIGEEAFDFFFKSNMRLVLKMALPYQQSGMPLSELVNEGSFGLKRGIEKFDWRLGFKFSTYGTWWIRQAIQRAMTESVDPIRIPQYQKERILKLGALESQGKSDEEIVMLLGLTPEKLADLREYATLQPIFLDQPLSPDGDTTLADFIDDENAADDLEAIFDDTGEKISEILEQLSQRERFVVEEYFLTLDADGKQRGYGDIGIDLGISRERVRQIKNLALMKIKWNAAIAHLESRFNLDDQEIATLERILGVDASNAAAYDRKVTAAEHHRRRRQLTAMLDMCLGEDFVLNTIRSVCEPNSRELAAQLEAWGYTESHGVGWKRSQKVVMDIVTRISGLDNS